MQVSIFLQDYVILERNTALDTFIISFSSTADFLIILLSAKNVMSLSEKNSKQNGYTLQFAILQKLL